MTKILIIGGARACGASTLLAKMNELGGLGADIDIIDGGDHPILRLAYAMSELLSPSGNYGDVVALQKKVMETNAHTFIHLRTDPATLAMRLRQRRLAGDEEFKRERLVNLDAYLDAVLPQLCRQRGIIYVPVRWGKGVTAYDIMPTIQRIMQQP